MKKQKNKILLIVFLVLASAFVITRAFRAPALESNLDHDLFRIDTSRVAALSFSRGGVEEETLTLTRNDSAWTVEQGNKRANVQHWQVNNVLQTLYTTQPERMVSRKEEKWDQYHVGDSAAIRLMAYDASGKVLGTWYIGKQSQGMTYLRAGDETEVYAVEGLLHARFDRDFDDWRDKSFLKIDRSFIDRIRFDYPADSGFVLGKKGGQWTIGNVKADSSRVDRYLFRIQSKDLSAFADDFSPAGEPDVTVEFSSKEIPHAFVKGWKQSANHWILSSALQPGVYFEDSTFADDLFVGRSYFTDVR